MTGNLFFDFKVDKANHQIYIKREFAAKRQVVWDCNTKAELLDQWFAPAPLTAKTKTLDFREGGTWHHAMIEPNGTEHWSLATYLKIRPIEYYSFKDHFSDPQGNINAQLPTTHWDSYFIEKDEHTLIHITASYQSLLDLETVVQMGFEQGMKSTLARLEEVLVAI